MTPINNPSDFKPIDLSVMRQTFQHPDFTFYPPPQFEEFEYAYLL